MYSNPWLRQNKNCPSMKVKILITVRQAIILTNFRQIPDMEAPISAAKKLMNRFIIKVIIKWKYAYSYVALQEVQVELKGLYHTDVTITYTKISGTFSANYTNKIVHTVQLSVIILSQYNKTVNKYLRMVKLGIPGRKNGLVMGGPLNLENLVLVRLETVQLQLQVPVV
jgi:hypothetical protein